MLTVVAVLLMMAPAALGDGDPASDVLAGQPVFLPFDAGGTPAQRAVLEATVLAARRAGYPLRVAVIASRADLGSIGQLWGRPQPYAEFLGQELSLVAPGRVLVVMPHGFGLSAPGVTPAGDEAQLVRAPAPPRLPNLTEVASDAVENLAGAMGHPISAGSVHVIVPRATGGGFGPVSVAVLGAGIVALLVAWGLSLRARPLGRPSRLGTPSRLGRPS